jgi:hypothetical protein
LKEIGARACFTKGAREISNFHWTWQLSISALPRIRPITSAGSLEVNPVPARIDGPIRFMQVS